MTEPTAADVQEELQEYLNSKNINALFIQIVERLLIEKPENPIGFIVEYLQKTYPDQATVAVNKTTNDKSLSDDEDEDEEDPGGDEVDELPVRPVKAAPVKRRQSVSAESLDPNKAKGEIKRIPKNEEESKRILDILKHNKFLTHLEDKQMMTLVEAFEGVDKKAGDVIIRQGDIGDNFYVVDQGKVEVYKKSGDGPDVKVYQYDQGDSFGELAIMYNAPRAATCKAATDVKLWALDRVSFKTIIMNAAIGKRSLYKDFLQRVEILKQLDEYEILTIADCLQEESFNNGDIIFRQGEPGDCFYIVKEGTAVCLQKDANGKDVEVAHLKVGNYFGEVALLTTKKRQATVRAGPGCKLLSLDRGTFKRVLGPIEDVLHRNMETYNQVRASAV